MDTFGDPGWFHHQQIAQIWGLTALRLATSQVIRFCATAYTDKLESYLSSLRSQVLDMLGGDLAIAKSRIDLPILEDAVQELAKYAKYLDSKAKDLKTNPKRRTCFMNMVCVSWSRIAEIETVNKAYLRFERGFIGDGLPGRPIYKHVIYAPGTWEGYAGLTFPSIREAVADQRWDEAKEQVHVIANLLKKAASDKESLDIGDSYFR